MKLKLGRYRHYKGKEYEVMGFVRDSESLKRLVLYRALYDSEEFGKNALWVRPEDMFFEMVDVDRESVPRFEYVG